MDHIIYVAKCKPLSIKLNGDSWAAQSVKHLTPDFGPGYDLMVCEFEPHRGLRADSVEPAWDSPSLSAPPVLSLKISKISLKNFF